MATSDVNKSSALGPILRLLCVTNHLSAFRNNTPFVFADDIKVVCALRPEVLGSDIAELNKKFTLSNSSVNEQMMGFTDEICRVF